MLSILTVAVLLGVPPVSPQPRSARTPSAVDVLIDTGAVLAHPFKLEPLNALVLAPAAVGAGLLLHFDVPIHHHIHHRWPDPVVHQRRLSFWGSYLGEGSVDMGIFLAIGIVGEGPGERVCLEGLEALAATAITSRALKLLLRVERPSFDASRKHVFSRNWRADAFPSGHTMTAFASAAVLAKEFPEAAPVFYGLAAYVGIARIQQSTHWASDVVVGAALGLLYGWAAAGLHPREGSGLRLPGLRVPLVVVPDGQGLMLAGEF